MSLRKHRRSPLSGIPGKSPQFGGATYTSFSTTHQPLPEERIQKVCRKGLHSMEEGDPNVYIEKSTGKRLCRQCRKDSRKADLTVKEEEDLYTHRFISGDPTVISMEGDG